MVDKELEKKMKERREELKKNQRKKGEGQMTELDKAYMHWLYQAVGMGNRGLLRSLETIGTPQEIYQMAVSDRLEEKVAKRYQNKITYVTECARDYDVQGEYECMKERGIQMVTVSEAGYPERLKDIPDAPYILYYTGRLPSVEHKSVALIGARDCTEYGRYMAGQFGAGLAQAGVQVISGMARGIDGIGQQAALREGGYSLGVLGCGVDICYPRENRELYDTLAKQGGICSEYPPGIGPRAVLFPPRNRIISGMADAVLVIEAKDKSGTLITVDMALEQGREVYALPGRGTDPLSRGCNRLIRQGAGLVSTPTELLEELFADYQSKEEAVQQKLVFLSRNQQDILRLMDINPQSAEMLQHRYVEEYGNRLTFPELLHELLQLCADGHVKQVAGNYFAKCPE